MGSTAALLPSTINGWENVAFKALAEMNRGKLERDEIEWEAVASKVRADAQRVSSRAPPPQHFVHCECVLLSHMLSHEESFVNYIGVSKLCCRGCFNVIQSVNFAKGTRFAIKGCHHKWCYPWKFSPLPETTKNVVVKLLYTDLATLFGNIYSGFRPKDPKSSIVQRRPLPVRRRLLQPRRTERYARTCKAMAMMICRPVTTVLHCRTYARTGAAILDIERHIL